MVQKQGARPRGRPRAYDPDLALERATEAFWDGGFSGTSLDDLTARTGMNRPSLYAAFGDKQALYLKTLDAYRLGRRELAGAALAMGGPFREVLRAIYRRIVQMFTAGERGAHGCYLVSTASAEAINNPRVRKLMALFLGEMDALLAKGFASAQERGELDAAADPQALGAMAAAVVHTLALRARAGQEPAALQAFADSAVRVLCPPEPRPGRQRRATPRRRGRAL